MKKFAISDINLLTKTVLIGLPGVGKSTLSDELCKIAKEDVNVELESVSSDLRLRDVRRDPNHPVVKKFMKEHHIPDSDFPLLIKTNDFIKKYGEQTFRDLESDVVIDMLNRGEFEGKIPNLGGKAMLHKKTAEAFKKKGYHVIYLKTSVRKNTEHIIQDFEALNDGAVITRSNINGPILGALKKSDPKYADVSPKKLILSRISKMQKMLKSDNPTKAIKKAELSRQKELYRYEQRIKLRNSKAFEVMSKFDKERDVLYQEVADYVLTRTSDIHHDALEILSTIREAGTDSVLNKTSRNRD